ncbi:hypothetical protein Thiosp_01901 [Thiorhodovibrio litoralis]|uniref:hypothetical protein n=2 Tax=Thiorhodovibrio TaxID=61593 RepID=UPI001913BB9B|nr:hypothetical protein [Thiorhodovibrio winogradskyi]MBK5969811.1 hypothetical protein [Thiorhodovibrio winogradskyi]WPL12145.1 hypothetical protein Thiosp_01901 [Thiorhodovibrio litoralis]
MGEQKSGEKNLPSKRRIVLLSIAGIVAIGLGSWVTHWRIDASGDAMAEVASELGLQVHQKGRQHQLRGRIDDIDIAVETTSERVAGDIRYFTDFEIRAPDQPAGRIVGAGIRQNVIAGMTGAESLIIGDPAFDEAVFLEGDQATLLAHLDAEARSAVITATKAGWELEDFTWSNRKSGRVTNAEKIGALLDAGMAAAQALRLSNDQSAALRERAEKDPLPGVRAAAAEAMNTRAINADALMANVSAAPEPVTPENALEALDEYYTPRSLEAALMLAAAGDDRQDVRSRLSMAIMTRERIAESIEALAKVGGPGELTVLNSVFGEHEAAAKAAIAEIEARQ